VKFVNKTEKPIKVIKTTIRGIRGWTTIKPDAVVELLDEYEINYIKAGLNKFVIKKVEEPKVEEPKIDNKPKVETPKAFKAKIGYKKIETKMKK